MTLFIISIISIIFIISITFIIFITSITFIIFIIMKSFKSFIMKCNKFFIIKCSKPSFMKCSKLFIMRCDLTNRIIESRFEVEFNKFEMIVFNEWNSYQYLMWTSSKLNEKNLLNNFTLRFYLTPLRLFDENLMQSFHFWLSLSLFCWTKVDFTEMASRNRDFDFNANSAEQKTFFHVEKHENLTLMIMLIWCPANGFQQAVLRCFMQMAHDSRQNVQEWCWRQYWCQILQLLLIFWAPSIKL